MLITLIVYLAILAILWWLITSLPLPPPMGIVAKVVFAVIAIALLLSLIGGGGLGLGLGHGCGRLLGC